MKRLSLFFLLFGMMVIANAKPIDVQTAMSAAETFVVRQAPIQVSGLRMKMPKLTEMTQAKTSGSGYYVFNNGDDNGFVIVSANDCAHPILGYSDKGHFDESAIPENMRNWLVGYEQEIEYATENDLTADEETRKEWDGLLRGSSIKTATIKAGPLLKTTWDQGAPYNNLCPYDNSAKSRSVTGCVATAMAQVMAYWQYPEKGQGYHSYTHDTYGLLSANFGATTYAWANMKDDYSGSSTYAQKQAVATLMYHCGVATDMQYSPEESGTYLIKDYYKNPRTDNDVVYAMQNYFGYKLERTGMKNYDIMATEWLSLLKADLDNSRPVIYAGMGSGGHCFVCDGYDSNNYFHFNWGWGGYADGYFKLTALEPVSGGTGGGDYTYNNYQHAIFGLEPDIPENPATFDLQLYCNITAPDSVYFFEDLTSYVEIANNGESAFNGTIAGVLFDADGNFFDFLDYVDLELESSYYYKFSSTYSGKAAFSPGVYYLIYYYMTDTQGWTEITSSTYSDYKKITVWYYDGIEVYSDFRIDGKMQQDNTVTIEVDIANITGEKFEGDLRLNLANLSDGSWTQNIDILSNYSLEDGYYYTCTFVGEITVEPGTYLLEAAYLRAGEETWYYAGSWYYANPIHIVVERTEVEPDPYENNDKESMAFYLDAVYFQGKGTVEIPDATLHVSTDVDYFAIKAPDEMSYTLSVHVDDASNNSNYSVETNVSFFNTENNIISEVDDAQTYTIPSGETGYIVVRPNLAGTKGTYALRIEIQQNISESIEDNERPQREFQKVIHEGNFYILQDDIIYNAQGARVE